MTTRGRHRAPARHARPKKGLPLQREFTIIALTAALATTGITVLEQVVPEHAAAAPAKAYVNVQALATPDSLPSAAKSVDRIVVRKEIKVDVAFEVQATEDPALASGTKFVQSEGALGQARVLSDVLYVNGEPVRTTEVSRKIVKTPVAEVAIVGTGDAKQISVQLATAAKATGTKETNQHYAKLFIAQEYGWNDKQFTCLVSLWNRESNWRAAARNRHSGATGIPQALPGRKMAAFGSDWKTNPVTQIKWGASYIAKRYDTPCGALSHSHARGWY